MTAPAAKGPGAPPPGPPPFTRRTMAALLGIFLGAMVSGINNRVGALGLADIRGALGASSDAASWLSTVYSAGELLVMPFAGWFAITLGVRRFHQYMIAITCVIAALLPFTQNLHLMIGMRFVQGMAAGSLIPILMMAALRFLPPPIRLHGLALYSMTATVAPNLAVQFVGFWPDIAGDWRWIYWEIVPAGIIAAALVRWGLPDDPILWPRFKQGDWLAMALGVPGLIAVIVTFDQGNRLEWFSSGLIRWSACAAVLLVGMFIALEWRHPTPFLKLQLLGRRNLAIGFSCFLLILMVTLSSSMIPSSVLGALHEYRALQIAPLSLVIALPQIVVAPGIALLLYQKWVDARKLFALGLLLMASACFLGADMTSDWIRGQFLLTQMLQCIGQPMAIVSLLFLCTSVVQPMEGPYVAGTVNTLRALGTTFGAAAIERLIELRSALHSEGLIDLHGRFALPDFGPAATAGEIAQQAMILSTADALRVLGMIALVLIPFVLRMQYIPAPDLSRAPGKP